MHSAPSQWHRCSSHTILPQCMSYCTLADIVYPDRSAHSPPKRVDRSTIHGDAKGGVVFLALRHLLCRYRAPLYNNVLPVLSTLRRQTNDAGYVEAQTMKSKLLLL